MSDQVVEQELDYPDNNYEGGLGVDEKEPELKWAIPGHAAVPELFNWLGRKATEDIQRIRDFLAEYESVRRLSPMAGLNQVSSKEADIVYVNNHQPAFSFSSNREVTVSGSAQVLRTTVNIVLYWSMPNVETTDTNPTIDLDVDIVGVGKEAGDDTMSASQDLSVPDQDNVIQRNTFTFGVGIGDIDEDGWDDILGQEIDFFINREPKDAGSGRWQLHAVEVR